jgi:hypothetical protein
LVGKLVAGETLCAVLGREALLTMRETLLAELGVIVGEVLGWTGLVALTIEEIVVWVTLLADLVVSAILTI